MGVVLDKIQLVLVLITSNELMAVPSTEYSTRTAILDLSSLITLGEKDILLDLMVLEGFTGCV